MHNTRSSFFQVLISCYMDFRIFLTSTIYSLQELRERVLRGKYRIPFYMSTDCENLLKRFLVLSPAKRGTLEQIMKDRWINAGYEEDELKPYTEPELDITDQKRIGNQHQKTNSQQAAEAVLRIAQLYFKGRRKISLPLVSVQHEDVEMC
ncbi:hypothetical protein GOODEAATRI_027295 [Goodea atripinnis]|uniref:non-specific serine/threonine protein kinase n=1 Tax=Goodea atripinnis TaxID=208336 RepID=A0ABV0NY87_9TELE